MVNPKPLLIPTVSLAERSLALKVSSAEKVLSRKGFWEKVSSWERFPGQRNICPGKVSEISFHGWNFHEFWEIFTPMKNCQLSIFKLPISLPRQTLLSVSEQQASARYWPASASCSPHSITSFQRLQKHFKGAPKQNVQAPQHEPLCNVHCLILKKCHIFIYIDIYRGICWRRTKKNCWFIGTFIL